MGFQRKEHPLAAILPTVRVRPEELQSVKNAALAAGLSVSAYIRSRVLADCAPNVSQSASNPVSSDPLLSSQPLAPSASPETGSNLFSQTPAEEQKKIAGRESIHLRAKTGECAHGFRLIGGLTACGECKRK